LINPGDEVIYPDPGFPIYESMARFVGGKPVPMPLREERRFRFDPDEFRSLVSDRTRLIIINSPHNPTGRVLTRDDLEVVADVARAPGFGRRQAGEVTGRPDGLGLGTEGLAGRRRPRDGRAFQSLPNHTRAGHRRRGPGRRLPQKGGVACLSGTAFGDYGE